MTGKGLMSCILSQTRGYSAAGNWAAGGRRRPGESKTPRSGQCSSNLQPRVMKFFRLHHPNISY
jgi:hypothetical protein